MARTVREERLANGLTPLQAQVIAAMLEEPTQTAAAEKAGVSLTSITRYMREEPFRAALREASAGVLEAAGQRAAVAIAQAMDYLAQVVGDTEEPTGIRVRAAATVLDQGLKLRGFLDFEQRLQALEALAKEHNNV